MARAVTSATYSMEKGCPRGRMPKGLSPWDRMERKPLTKQGRAPYKLWGVLAVASTARAALPISGSTIARCQRKRLTPVDSARSIRAHAIHSHWPLEGGVA